VGSEKSLMWFQPIELMQGGEMEWSVVVSAAWRETLRDGRNSNLCDSETGEHSHEACSILWTQLPSYKM
jgi:hypothetical protein